MPVPCEDCGRNMSASAVVCPHCSHRQSDRDLVDPALTGPKKKPKSISISSEEAGALFEVNGIASGTMEYERPRGPMVLILPRAEASGWKRALEWSLTALALPLLLGSFMLLALRPRMWRWMADGGELAVTLAIGFFGSIGLLLIAFSAGLETPVAWGLTGISAGALVARVVVRSMRPS